MKRIGSVGVVLAAALLASAALQAQEGIILPRGERPARGLAAPAPVTAAAPIITTTTLPGAQTTTPLPTAQIDITL